MNRSLLLLLLLPYLSGELAYASYSGHTKEGAPLPMASARPLGVDQGIDCAIKELAWEYAKKLLPQVKFTCHPVLLILYCSPLFFVLNSMGTTQQCMMHCS